MKRIQYIAMLAMSIFLGLAGCYKDKGNYDIDIPAEPEVSELDTLYEAVAGDSLIIAPVIKGIAPEFLHCSWRIYVPEAPVQEDYMYEGNELRILFGLGA